MRLSWERIEGEFKFDARGGRDAHTVVRDNGYRKRVRGLNTPRLVTHVGF